MEREIHPPHPSGTHTPNRGFQPRLYLASADLEGERQAASPRVRQHTSVRRFGDNLNGDDVAISGQSAASGYNVLALNLCTNGSQESPNDRGEGNHHRIQTSWIAEKGQENAMSRIVVVGSANIDFVFRTSRCPNPGETLSGEGWAVHSGGKGANQAVAAAKLGGDVLFVAKVGNDPQTDAMLEAYRQAGLRTDGILRTDAVPTGAASIWVDALGQNRIIVVAGANGELQSDEVFEAASGFAETSYALLQHETPSKTVDDTILRMPDGVRVLLNPAPARQISPLVLARLWLVTPNELETEAITGVRPFDASSCEKASEWFFRRGVLNVIITLGERGCWVHENGKDGVIVPAPEVSVVDTTAAGDAFNGALATFLSEGIPLKEAAHRANYVAALSVTRAGAQSSLPTRAELENFWKRG